MTTSLCEQTPVQSIMEYYMYTIIVLVVVVGFSDHNSIH